LLPAARRLQGSLQYTSWQLAAYCYWLHGRVAARFDRAAERGAAQGMAECAAIMHKFEAEATLVQVGALVGLLALSQSVRQAGRQAGTGDVARGGQRLRLCCLVCVALWGGWGAALPSAGVQVWTSAKRQVVEWRAILACGRAVVVT
jgi:hypothetical protein